MTILKYLRLKARLLDSGYAEEIAWSGNIGRCASADDFAIEYAFVVCNSGMKAQVARGIFDRIRAAQNAGASAHTVFGHKGKAAAIDAAWAAREELFHEFSMLDSDAARVEWLGQRAWIGEITKWHLAKNLGVNCCKPDRHLTRIAATSRETPAELCERIASETGDKIAMVDLIIWRAANLGWV